MKKIASSIFFAWLIFIGIDFFFHATLLSNLWLLENPVLKSLDDLAVLIPVGYASFLLLTILCGWLYHQIFPTFQGYKKVMKFGLLFSGLFSVANLLGMYSYLNLDLDSILLFNLVYFIELVAVFLIFAYMQKGGKRGGKIRNVLLLFFGLIVLSIIIQNIFQNYQVGG